MPKQDCLLLPYEPLRRQLRELCDFIEEVKKPKRGYTPGAIGKKQRDNIIAPFLGVKDISVSNQFIKSKSITIPIYRLRNFQVRFEVFFKEIDLAQVINYPGIGNLYSKWKSDINEQINSFEKSQAVKKKRQTGTNPDRSQTAGDGVEISTDKKIANDVLASFFHNDSSEPSITVEQNEKEQDNNIYAKREKEREMLSGEYLVYHDSFFRARKKQISSIRTANLSIAIGEFGLAHSTLSFTECEFPIRFEDDFGAISISELRNGGYADFINKYNSPGYRPFIKLIIFLPSYPINKIPEVLYGEFYIRLGYMPFTWSRRRRVIIVNQRATSEIKKHAANQALNYCKTKRNAKEFFRSCKYNVKEIAHELKGYPTSLYTDFT